MGVRQVKPTDTTDVVDETPDDTEREADEELVEYELLVEEISIDGMCGV